MNWFSKSNLQQQYQSFSIDSDQAIESFISMHFTDAQRSHYAREQLKLFVNNMLQKCETCLKSQEEDCSSVCNYDAMWNSLQDEASRLIRSSGIGTEN